MMELPPEYWALHKWLSKAWLLGVKSEITGQFRPVGMWAVFGPDWQEEVAKIARDKFLGCPERWIPEEGWVYVIPKDAIET
jgi:hypothetical protein